MTIAHLIELLSNLPQDYEVCYHDLWEQIGRGNDESQAINTVIIDLSDNKVVLK